MTSKGQVTVPKRVREKLGLEPGSKISFILRGEQAVMMRRSDDPLGDLRKMRREVSFGEEEIESMIRKSKQTWSKLQ
jgi:AbrB family looped-hinge helix DNA binding protein